MPININKFQYDWDNYEPPIPSFLGEKKLTGIKVSDIRGYVDWTIFFRSWDLAGQFPKILNDDVVGDAATTLYQDALVMLDELERDNFFKLEAVIGFWPAAQENENEVNIFNEKKKDVITKLNFLRQQININK